MEIWLLKVTLNIIVFPEKRNAALLPIKLHYVYLTKTWSKCSENIYSTNIDYKAIKYI